jgi:uncharacterized protein (TIGR02217 family)
MSILPFTEERLAISEALNFAPLISDTTGGNQWATTRIEQDNGFVHLSQNWESARWKGTLGGRQLFKADFLYLKDFYLSRRGQIQGFRYKNWADFYRDSQFVGTTTGGPQQIQLRTDEKIVTKPVQDTVFYKIGDSNWIPANNPPTSRIDLTTGIITTDTLSVGSGHPITAKFEFDIPVRFNSDFRYRYEAMSFDNNEFAVTIDSLDLIEITPSSIPNYNVDYSYSCTNAQRWNYDNSRYGQCVPATNGTFASRGACEIAYPSRLCLEEYLTFAPAQAASWGAPYCILFSPLYPNNAVSVEILDYRRTPSGLIYQYYIKYLYGDGSIIQGWKNIANNLQVADITIRLVMARSTHT